MYPGQDHDFGAPIEPPGGPFSGGSGGFEGPPPADALFESFIEDSDDLPEAGARGGDRESDVLAAGLHFFEKMKGMR